MRRQRRNSTSATSRQTRRIDGAGETAPLNGRKRRDTRASPTPNSRGGATSRDGGNAAAGQEVSGEDVQIVYVGVDPEKDRPSSKVQGTSATVPSAASNGDRETSGSGVDAWEREGRGQGAPRDGSGTEKGTKEDSEDRSGAGAGAGAGAGGQTGVEAVPPKKPKKKYIRNPETHKVYRARMEKELAEAK
ncbi:unnamed protein product, partial [Discosporangium mesarthrocarpum]